MHKHKLRTRFYSSSGARTGIDIPRHKCIRGGLGRRVPNRFVLTAPAMTIRVISQHVRRTKSALPCPRAAFLETGIAGRFCNHSPDIASLLVPEAKERGWSRRCQTSEPPSEISPVTPLVTSRFAPQETCDDVHDPQTSPPSVSSPLVGPLARRLAIRQPLVPSVLCLAPTITSSVISGDPPRTVIYPPTTEPTFLYACTPYCNKSCGAVTSLNWFSLAFSDFA